MKTNLNLRFARSRETSSPTLRQAQGFSRRREAREGQIRTGLIAAALCLFAACGGSAGEGVTASEPKPDEVDAQLLMPDEVPFQHSGIRSLEFT